MSDAPTSEKLSELKLAELTASVVSAYVAKNALPAADLPAFIKSVSESFKSEPEAVEPQAAVPVVPIRKSITQDRIICLVCGKPCKTLRRHLSTAHGMTGEDYRRTYNLPASYPLVTPEYSANRSEMAKQIGLGKQGRAARLSATSRKKRSTKAAA